LRNLVRRKIRRVKRISGISGVSKSALVEGAIMQRLGMGSGIVNLARPGVPARRGIADGAVVGVRSDVYLKPVEKRSYILY
jgi:hypothetical protein